MNPLVPKFIFSVLLVLFVFQALGAPLITAAQTNAGAQPNVSQEEAARRAAKAKADEVKSSIGAPDYGAECGWTDIVCGILKAVNWLLDSVGYIIITIPAALFEGAIQVNSGEFISGIKAVEIGWGVARDVANMFFIIILIVVALATIFELETFNVKSVLPKLITIALLINFSLIIGQFVINQGNALGGVFYGRLIAKYKGVDKAIEEILNYRDAKAKALGEVGSGEIEQFDRSASTKEKVEEIASKTKITHEGKEYTQADCEKLSEEESTDTTGLGNFQAAAGCTKLSTQITVEAQKALNLTKLLANAIIVKIIIYPIAIFVLLAGAVMLLGRLITLIFVLILAPLAFMAYLVPTMKGQWDKWWKTLFDQSFFFPAFMFFFMIAVDVFDGIKTQLVLATKTQAGALPFLDTMISYFIGAGLMIGALIAAKQMGAYGAAGAVNLGKKYLGKVKDYGKTRATSAALRVTKTPAEEFSKGLSERIGRHPVLGTVLGGRLALRATEAVARAAGGEEKGREETLKKLDARALAVEYDRAVAPETKTLIERVAAETGKMGKFRPEAQQEIYAKMVADPTKVKQQRQIETAHPNVATVYWEGVMNTPGATDQQKQRALGQIKRIPAGMSEKDINERAEAELLDSEAFMDAAAEVWTPEKHEAAANKFGARYLEALAKAYNRIEARDPKKLGEIFKNEKMRKFYLGNPLLAATNPWLQTQVAARQNELAELPNDQLLSGYQRALNTRDQETVRKIESQRPDIAIQYHTSNAPSAEEIDRQVRRVVASIPEKAIEDGTVDKRFLQTEGVMNQIVKGWSVKKLETAMDKVEGFVDEYARELENVAQRQRPDFDILIQDVSKKNFIAQSQVLARMAPTAHRAAGGSAATEARPMGFRDGGGATPPEGETTLPPSQ